jgi:hypothetical protein
VLGRRRPSAATAELESARRAAYAEMNPGERLRRAMRVSAFALRLRAAAAVTARRP